MLIQVWEINVNYNKDKFATKTMDAAEAILVYKSYWEKKYPEKKNFDVHYIQKLHQVRMLEDVQVSD